MPRILVLLTLLLPLVAAAQSIYRTVDENGNVVFTDQPDANSVAKERVDIQPINTTPAVEPAPPPKLTPAEPTGPGYEVAITAPANETTIAMGPGNFSVSASVSPALGNGNQLQLLMDGAPSGEPQSSGSWQLTNVFRGAHDLSVAVISREGERLTVSEPVRVYVLRPSVNSPARRGN